MIKKFFVAMLGSMAAIWLSLIIFSVITVIVISAIFAKALGGEDKSDKSILYVNLSGSIVERETSPTFDDLLSYSETNPDALSTIIASVRKAADDKKIKGIYIDCGGSELGYASRSELIEAIEDFKKSGKWVYAYADNYEQGDYYVATAADSVYINPAGMLNVRGLASETMFFKDVLDKLGIDVTVVRVGSYKSAVEPFMRMDMSEESRRQTTIFIDTIWSEVKSTIAKNMDLLGPQIVNAWADSLVFTWPAERYLQQGAVTRLCYRSEVEDIIRDVAGVDSGKELPLITPNEYMNLDIKRIVDKDRDHIAVLYAVGEIYDTGNTGIVDDNMVPEILRLAEDDHVKGMVLRVNSPGGSAFASEQIWHALEDFKATGKPLYVSMGDYAASGGYYISCGAERIYCDAATLTGSIGIFGLLPNAEKLVKDKIGLGIETVETNSGATFPSFYVAPTEQQKEAMQRYVEQGYDLFVSRVSQGRDIPVDSVKAIGGGRVWAGLSAIEIGLVDEIGSLDKAVEDLASELNMDKDHYVCYPEQTSNPLVDLLMSETKNMEVGASTLSAQHAMEYVDYIHKFKTMAPVQARMPYLKVK